MSLTQWSSRGGMFVTFTATLQCQSVLRDSIGRVKTQISGLEQLLTLTVVTLPPNTPQTNAFVQQLVNEITSRKKSKNDMVCGNNKTYYMYMYVYLKESEMKDLDKVIQYI